MGFTRERERERERERVARYIDQEENTVVLVSFCLRCCLLFMVSHPFCPCIYVDSLYDVYTYVIICFCQFVITLYLLIGNQNLAYKKRGDGIKTHCGCH